MSERGTFAPENIGVDHEEDEFKIEGESQSSAPEEAAVDTGLSEEEETLQVEKKSELPAEAATEVAEPTSIEPPESEAVAPVESEVPTAPVAESEAMEKEEAAEAEPVKPQRKKNEMSVREIREVLSRKNDKQVLKIVNNGIELSGRTTSSVGEIAREKIFTELEEKEAYKQIQKKRFLMVGPKVERSYEDSVKVAEQLLEERLTTFEAEGTKILKSKGELAKHNLDRDRAIGSIRAISNPKERARLMSEMTKRESGKEKQIAEEEKVLGRALERYREPFEAKNKEAANLEKILQLAMNELVVREHKFQDKVRFYEDTIMETGGQELLGGLEKEIIKSLKTELATMERNVSLLENRRQALQERLDSVSLMKQETQVVLDRIKAVGKLKQRVEEDEAEPVKKPSTVAKAKTAAVTAGRVNNQTAKKSAAKTAAGPKNSARPVLSEKPKTEIMEEEPEPKAEVEPIELTVEEWSKAFTYNSVRGSKPELSLKGFFKREARYEGDVSVGEPVAKEIIKRYLVNKEGLSQAGAEKRFNKVAESLRRNK